MKKEMSEQARGAKNIRKELKVAFPGIKFSVRSNSFAGGNSINIEWTEGPTREEVENIANKYEQGSFDGMTDCYNYKRNCDFTDENGGAKYVQTHRNYSTGLTEKTSQKLCVEQGIKYEGENTRHLYGDQDFERLSLHVWRKLNKTSFITNQV